MTAVTPLNRWARIGSKAQDKNVVFSNLHSHSNVDSLTEAFKALDGKKVLDVEDNYKDVLNQILKSPVREIRKRGSVRELPLLPAR